MNKNKKVINKVERLIALNGGSKNQKIKKAFDSANQKKDSKNIKLGKVLWTRRKKRVLN